MACGSGVQFDPVVRANTGTYPAEVFLFQQRLGFANTRNQPMTLWASRVDEFNNFSASAANADDEAYSYTIDGESIDPIRHAVSVQNGLLIFTATGVATLTGSDNATAPVTPNNARLVFESFVGAAEVRPEVVGNEVLYVRDQSRSVQLLTYNATARRFDNAEISVLSRHLFKQSPVRSLAFTHATNRKGIGVFENGEGFMLTLDSTQRVFAFSPLITQGQMRDCVSVQYGQQEQFYIVVDRGEFVAVERMREAPTREPEMELWLDSAVRVEFNYPDGEVKVEISGTSGTVTIVDGTATFAAEDVGKVLGVSGGRLTISTFTSETEVSGTWTRDPSLSRMQFNYPIYAEAGKWWLMPIVGQVSGSHFRGQRVVAVVDGRLTESFEPTSTTITLPIFADLANNVNCGLPPLTSASGTGWGQSWGGAWGGDSSNGVSVVIGLPYSARVETLPLLGSEGLRSNVTSMTMMLGRHENFCVGRTDALLSAGGPEDFGKYFYDALVTTPAVRDIQIRPSWYHVPLESGWDYAGSVFAEASVGLPLEILQMILHDWTGDEIRTDQGDPARTQSRQPTSSVGGTQAIRGST